MFKNVSKLLDASIFKNSNNYILQHQNLRVCPASQLYNADESLSNLTPFNASMLALSFSTQHKQLSKFLQLPNPTALYLKQCSAQHEISQELSNQFIQHCYLTFNDQTFDIPFSGYSSFMKASVLMNKADTQYFEKIMPRILTKLPHADKQGLEDLMWVMAELNIKSYKESILAAWQSKNTQNNTCHLDGWKVDQYQEGEEIKQHDLFQQYFNDIQNKKLFPDQRHQLRQIAQVLKARIANRIFFRESRITQELQIQRDYDIKQVEKKLQHNQLA